MSIRVRVKSNHLGYTPGEVAYVDPSDKLVRAALAGEHFVPEDGEDDEVLDPELVSNPEDPALETGDDTPVHEVQLEAARKVDDLDRNELVAVLAAGGFDTTGGKTALLARLAQVDSSTDEGKAVLVALGAALGLTPTDPEDSTEDTTPSDG